MTTDTTSQDRPAGPKEPSRVDIHIGRRLRGRRILLGMTQQELGRPLGLSYQQLQKYETGLNRVAAGRLFDIGRVLQVPVSYFFEGLEQPEVTPPSRRHLELFRAVTALPEGVQYALLDLAKSLRAPEEAAGELEPVG